MPDVLTTPTVEPAVAETGPCEMPLCDTGGGDLAFCVVGVVTGRCENPHASECGEPATSSKYGRRLCPGCLSRVARFEEFTL